MLPMWFLTVMSWSGFLIPANSTRARSGKPKRTHTHTHARAHARARETLDWMLERMHTRILARMRVYVQC